MDILSQLQSQIDMMVQQFFDTTGILQRDAVPASLLLTTQLPEEQRKRVEYLRFQVQRARTQRAQY